MSLRMMQASLAATNCPKGGSSGPRSYDLKIALSEIEPQPVKSGDLEFQAGPCRSP